jgi:hypothetical protein
MAAADDTKSGAQETLPPPSSGRDPREVRDSRIPLDRVLPEILKRGLSAGRDVSETIFPKELASYLAAQLVDARSGLVTAIATEVGRFLRQADIASEVRKVLAGLNVEAKVQLRFSEDESGKLRSRLDIDQASAGVGARRKSTPPPEDV